MSPITPRPRSRRDGSTAWQVPFRINGRQTSETFPDRQGATRFARLVDQLGPAAALDTLRAWEGATGDTTWTLATWAEHHVDTLTGVQPDTAHRYRAYIRNDLGALAHLPLSAVTEDTVGRWVNELAATGAAGSTIAKKHGFLSAVLDHATRQRLIPHNPAKGTRLPRTVTEPMVFLTHDEYARFLDYVTPYWQPLVTVLFSTGLRWGEATALQAGDVDLERGTITVTRAWKNGRVLGPPKSKRSRRTISVPPETLEVLRPLVEGKPADAWVFRNQQGGPVRHQTFHENVWQPAVRLANGEPAAAGKRVARRIDGQGRVIEPATVPLGKRPRIHDARHTCASWLLGAGVPINVVQAHLGHESITTSVDRYGHIMPAARAMVSNALSLALTAAHPQIEA